MNEILMLIFLTLMPFLELRASIPYGIFTTDMHFLLVFFICVVINIILGIVLFVLLDKIIFLIKKIKAVERIYDRYVERTQRKIHNLIERYGELAVAVFIGIPMPGSGVYSGALAAYLIGLDFKKFIIADILGVLIAGILVTIASLTGIEAFQFFIKMI